MGVLNVIHQYLYLEHNVVISNSTLTGKVGGGTSGERLTKWETSKIEKFVSLEKRNNKGTITSNQAV